MQLVTYDYSYINTLPYIEYKDLNFYFNRG